MPAVPRPASTVVLLRDSPGGPQVFMVKRSSRSAFMPSAHVFPGGRVEDEDAALPVVGGEADAARLDLPDARAWQAAAIRETFEEAGFLLGQGEVRPEDRAAVQSGARPFHALQRERGWVLDASGLLAWAWWITPELEPRRFDTRFFVARAPSDQEGRHDERETVGSAWWTVPDTLAYFDTGEIQLAPPTYVTLAELAAFPTVDAVLGAARQRVLAPIQPRGLLHRDGSLSILMPGDELFPSARPVQGPTRVTLRGGRWLVHR